MKLFVSADIEGIAGINHPEETDPSKPVYGRMQSRMTDHVAAACEGAVSAGVTEIVVRDAHAHGRNLLDDELPRCVRLVRGWSSHPFLMVQELEDDVSAVAMIGYHAWAGSGGNPLAHTLNGSAFFEVSLNGRPVSEFEIYTYAAALARVPVVFVSGDEAVCDRAREMVPGIHVVPVMRGVGASTISIHPEEARERIHDEMARAIEALPSIAPPALPDHFRLQVAFKDAPRAVRMGFYPGASLEGPRTVCFAHENYTEILRFLVFAAGF